MKRSFLCSLLVGLLAVFAAGSLLACSKKPALKIEREEALSVLKELVPRSYELNVIFFGEGLPAVAEAYEEEHTKTAYFPVREDAAYASVEAIESEAEKVYSRRYLEEIYVGAFVGMTSDEGEGLLTSVSPRYKEIGGVLHIDVSVQPLSIRGKLEVTDAEIKKSTPEYVELTVTCLEGGQEIQLSILLTLQDGVWLLDSPTY